ncbi:AIPR family protein [Mucilaginibacter sp. L196]|uniref:AIPR family protein n=1 Tax=Mucilaginibacter sp. L196 TaxID=1641870 RepID=UPI00131AD771|nr:AIPR family protein [Mucilaginibacter sp. L196]
MNLRQQIIVDHIEKTASKLNTSNDKGFQIFGHSIFTDNSIHSFNPNDDVDGGQDKQIDSITIEESSDEATIYITQVKNEDSFSSNRIIHIRNGLQWLFEKPINDVNTITNIKFKDKIKDYRATQSNLGPSNINIKVAYITNGLSSELSDECIQEIKTITDTYDNETFSSFTFDIIGSAELVDIINAQEKKNKKINCEIKILYDTNNPSLIKYHSQGLKGIICSATAFEIATVVNNDKNGFVFDLNIRKYLGKLGGVNKDILNTCTNSNLSNLFWFLNNGVTIVCDKVDPVTDPDDAKVKIENMQIVNGCQTATSLANALREGHLQPDTKLLLRIYETNDLELVDKIVLTTNNQNKITGRNLRANDKTQFDLEKGFLLYGYSLERKPRQYESTIITKDNIVPNEELAVAYLGIVLRKPSDARSRKYKVWDEFYSKIFSGVDTVEPYLLSVLIFRKTSEYIQASFASSTDDTIRYLAKNASFHIARIVAFLFKNGDNWSNASYMKSYITSLIATPLILDSNITQAMAILNAIISSNSKFKIDLNNALKAAELDTEINKELNLNHKRA